MLHDSTEPNNFDEAMAGSNADEWRKAMNEEIAALSANGTWRLERPPPGARVLPCRWVYKVKITADGDVERYKARLVAKGYAQREGVDYGELFAPTSRGTSLRAMLAIAAAEGLVVHQLDVTTAFLNGELKEELWMEQPPGYETEDKSLACRLLKSIYGLKQAPRCWYEKLTTEFAKLGLYPSKSDPAMFIKTDERGMLVAIVHVDDTLVASKDLKLIEIVKKAIAKCFKVRDLGEAHVYLGMEIQRKENEEVVLSQQRYVEDLLRQYNMVDAKPRAIPLPVGMKVVPNKDTNILPDPTVYRALVGKLNYLAVNTRPDISYALSVLSRSMAKPTKSALNLAFGVLRYLSGTRSLGLRYGGTGAAELRGFSDSDWAGDPTTRRSTSGYVFLLNGGAISWSSQLQKTVAVSSVEAEYQALSASVREALWLRKLAEDLGFASDVINISVDSLGALSLGNNPITSARSKHIDVQHHVVRERVMRKEVNLEYCPTEFMVADIFTKPLGVAKFVWCREALGLG